MTSHPPSKEEARERAIDLLASFASGPNMQDALRGRLFGPGDPLPVNDALRAIEAVLSRQDRPEGVGERLRAEMRRVAAELHKTAPGGVSYAGTLLEKGSRL